MCIIPTLRAKNVQESVSIRRTHILVNMFYKENFLQQISKVQSWCRPISDERAGITNKLHIKALHFEFSLLNHYIRTRYKMNPEYSHKVCFQCLCEYNKNEEIVN